MPPKEYTFYWGDEIVVRYGHDRQQVWKGLQGSRYMEGCLTIEGLQWTGYYRGHMFTDN